MKWNKKHNRPTVGAIAAQAEHLGSPTNDVRELQRGMESNKMDHVHKALERGLKRYDSRYIYVVVLRIFDSLTKTIRNRYFPSDICPTPNFNQAVFEYDRDHGNLDLLYVLPALNTCNYLLANPFYLNANDRQLLSYIYNFRDGTLDRQQEEKNSRGK